MYSKHKKLETKTLQTRNVRSSGFIYDLCILFSDNLCNLCGLSLVKCARRFKLKELVLVNILTERENVFHLSEFSAKSEKLYL